MSPPGTDSPDESAWIDVVPASELGPGKVHLVEVDQTEIAIINLEGEYHAIEDRCSHDGSPILGCGLDLAETLEGDQLICPRHGSRFCIRSGEALTPPAYEPLSRFPVREQDGRVLLYPQALDDG